MGAALGAAFLGAAAAGFLVTRPVLVLLAAAFFSVAGFAAAFLGAAAFLAAGFAAASFFAAGFAADFAAGFAAAVSFLAAGLAAALGAAFLVVDAAGLAASFLAAAGFAGVVFFASLVPPEGPGDGLDQVRWEGGRGDGRTLGLLEDTLLDAGL